ncbi:MAG: adenylyl-sulfate kinase [Bythopirellula sp.]
MSEVEKPIVVWHEHAISRADREKLNSQRGCVVWFTGLSGCGKSTVANLVDQKLHERGARSYVLDGDNIRHGLSATPQLLKDRYGDEFAQRFGLGFSQQDREENIRRVGAVAGILADAGLIALTAFVSPYRADRNSVRENLPADDFLEIFVNASLATCEACDPKGLYQKARAGEIGDFTGISSPYEAPEQPELELDANDTPPDRLADQVVELLIASGKLS